MKNKDQMIQDLIDTIEISYYTPTLDDGSLGNTIYTVYGGNKTSSAHRTIDKAEEELNHRIQMIKKFPQYYLDGL